jgi:hypothetical protein
LSDRNGGRVFGLGSHRNEDAISRGDLLSYVRDLVIEEAQTQKA